MDKRTRRETLSIGAATAALATLAQAAEVQAQTSSASPKKLEPAQGDQVLLHVPKGAAKNVKIIEVDPAVHGREITLQVSKTRKAINSGVVGVIVK
jgi:hypothetical protein